MADPAKMTRSDFGELLTPIHKKIFFDSYNEKEKQYPSVFKVDTMDRKEQSFVHEGAFGLWSSNTEGSDFNLADFAEGDTVTLTARRFDKAYEVTWELVQDDQYNVFKGIGKGGSAKGLARSLHATEETEAAAIITGGFANEGYDGVALFDDAHPLVNSSSTVSNLVTGALTDANLKAALSLMRTQTDEAGILISTNAKQLVVSPDWEFTARAIINSTLQSGTNNNDVNTVPSLKIVVMDYLANDTTKPWFIQDTSVDNLLFAWREKPVFDSERIQNKMDYRMFGYCRFDCGYVDWRGLVGSTGVTEEPEPEPEGGGGDAGGGGEAGGGVTP